MAAFNLLFFPEYLIYSLSHPITLVPKNSRSSPSPGAAMPKIRITPYLVTQKRPALITGRAVVPYRRFSMFSRSLCIVTPLLFHRNQLFDTVWFTVGRIDYFPSMLFDSIPAFIHFIQVRNIDRQVLAVADVEEVHGDISHKGAAV